ncbi:MAG: hypothetical protein A2Y00_00535 [Omnitrophica WOR_2 bacterium GWF2_43_52]|nr:MAG: hypothetical protein A2Y01_07705 [Omnitrophica WOR_2 bacterium GWC2_44_8]OGX20949.1 MAG: hypothetical protein A2Y00_00535 [Omnitrophica WOR_2 bacterium GWF2_43_52]OGX57142.1 MAG: hypothetical protein A2460_01175 [Omnitrophica WOR_2 bacterium RIFOXYC2_FULL_43_9]HAH21128.1 phosphatase [Candidatus Omnitrophota bacterium]HBG63270.1 phosphatase [Candidatus Omnitrophota bacterium]
MKYADLHLHTSFSDGTQSLSELIALAKEAHLRCISITDHDSVAAYLPALPVSDIEIIPGIELTADYNNTEVHILGYCIDYSQPWFQEKLNDICDVRVSRMREMCEKLTALGMPIAVEEIAKFAGHNCVGRLHLARMLSRKGFVSSVQEAFNKYIRDGGPAYVSHFRLSPQEVIALIRKAHGVPVLAHPYCLPFQDMIFDFIKDGLMGLEVLYPEHTPAQIATYLKIAQDNNLVVTGGSDYHGELKPDVTIGMIEVSSELIDALKDARKRVMNEN